MVSKEWVNLPRGIRVATAKDKGGRPDVRTFSNSPPNFFVRNIISVIVISE
jgi:hypothetical protein